MWPVHCVQDTFGAEYHSEIVTKPTDFVVSKGQLPRVESYSAFGDAPENTSLEQILRDNNITRIYCVGLVFDYCVGSTAYDAAL